LRRVICGVMAEQQNNLLWKKCEDGKVEKVRQALQAGADPNTTGGPCDDTCLMEAAYYNHDKVVALLLAHPNIQVNAKSEYNRTALHYACARGSLASLSKLLATPGVQLNERNTRGQTPIMDAIDDGQTEAVRQMAAVKEVDLDVKDNQGRSLEKYANRWAGDAAPAIVQVLEEARQKRRLVIVKEQTAKVGKVLLDGLYDPESVLNMLRMPIVKSPLMKRIWDLVTEDWQVYNEGGSAGEAP